MMETSSGSQENFIFSDSDVLSERQLEELETSRKSSDVQRIFRLAIDDRLKVRCLNSEMGEDASNQTSSPRFLVYFVSPVLQEMSLSLRKP